MGLTARDTSNGEGFEPVEEGMHQGICYSLYDLGTHYNEKFDKDTHKVLVVWELPEVRIQIERDGEELDLPRAISKKYTISLHEKSNLRKDLESWRGKKFTEEELNGFNLENILGTNCNIQVIHNKKDDKTYANVSTIIPLMKGQQKLKSENPTRFFSFEDGGDIPDGTPEWIEKIIQDSHEWEVRTLGENGKNGYSEVNPPMSDDSDIPF